MAGQFADEALSLSHFAEIAAGCVMSTWLPTPEFDAEFDRQWKRTERRHARRETAAWVKAGFRGATLRDLVAVAKTVDFGPVVLPAETN